MLRFMIIVETTPASEAGNMPGREMLEVMTRCHQPCAAVESFRKLPGIDR